KDVNFVPGEDVLEFKEKLFSLNEMAIILTLRQEWDLGEREDLVLMQRFKTDLREKEQKIFLPLERFYNIKTPEDAYQFSTKFLPQAEDYSLLTKPEILFNLLYSDVYNLPRKKVTSLDHAYWQGLGLKRAGYNQMYLVMFRSDVYEEKIYKPQWNFVLVFHDKETQEIKLLENNGYLEKKGLLAKNGVFSSGRKDVNEVIKDIAQGESYFIKTFNPPENILEALLGYYPKWHRELRKDSVLPYIEKNYPFRERAFRNQFLSRLFVENITFFQDIGKDRKTGFPYDHILMDAKDRVKDIGRYTQQPVIGLYLVLLTGIAKGDIKIEGFEKEEALNEIRNILVELKKLPRWNGLFYWYNLSQEEPYVTYEGMVNTYENGHLTASLALTMGAFIDEIFFEEGEEIELKKDIVKLAEEILEEQKRGYQILRNLEGIFINWEEVAWQVKEELERKGEWSALVKDLGIEEEVILSHWLYTVRSLLSDPIGGKETQEIIERIKQTNWWVKLREMGYRQMEAPVNVMGMGEITSLYTDGRAALIMQIALGATDTSIWEGLKEIKKSYKLQDGREISLLVPYEGAFQAWLPLIFFPEMEWSPDGFKKAHKNYALAQLDYGQSLNLPALFSAASNPYLAENKGDYVYAWQLGVPGASQYEVRQTNPIATPHANGLLYLVEPEKALKLFAELEMGYSGIKGHLGWRDSLGENGEFSNTYLSVDQLMLLTALNGANNHRYMENFLRKVTQNLEKIKKLYQDKVFDF
ncbi:MAG: hypothetical protein ACK4NT_05845, partial [Candidatus Omnitrophota bacterium]